MFLEAWGWPKTVVVFWSSLCYSVSMTNRISVTIHVNGTTVAGYVHKSTGRIVDAILSNEPDYVKEFTSTHIDFDIFDHIGGGQVQRNVRLLKTAITGIVYHSPTLRINPVYQHD